MQRREVERIAASDMSTPADLWLTGPDLAELLDDNGDIDETKVRAAVAAVLETRPGWRVSTPPTFDGGARQSAPQRVSMQQVLQGRRRS